MKKLMILAISVFTLTAVVGFLVISMIVRTPLDEGIKAIIVLLDIILALLVSMSVVQFAGLNKR